LEIWREGTSQARLKEAIFQALQFRHAPLVFLLTTVPWQLRKKRPLSPSSGE
jgi:hypothetical protein